MARDEAINGKRACCMVSEILEESGLDRAKARQIRRQVLEGIVLLCQWQLERIREHEKEAPPPKARSRRVKVD
jgi:hypothetical protein